jgi:hypothetical protein
MKSPPVENKKAVNEPMVHLQPCLSMNIRPDTSKVMKDPFRDIKNRAVKARFHHHCVNKKDAIDSVVLNNLRHRTKKQYLINLSFKVLPKSIFVWRPYEIA